MKYTAYFDESHIKKDGSLITICDSVDCITEVKAQIEAHMMHSNLPNDCLYMYKIVEEDYSHLNAYGVPESIELYWEDLLV